LERSVVIRLSQSAEYELLLFLTRWQLCVINLQEMSYKWRTSLYLAASASAEFFADIALCPMEAVKVRIQTKPGFASTLREGAPIIMREEGLTGFYKGLVPLWARQIPYTMMKFACFERTVEALYKYVVPKPRTDCTKGEQLGVTFVAGKLVCQRRDFYFYTRGLT